jgi:hypothetical protein
MGKNVCLQRARHFVFQSISFVGGGGGGGDRRRISIFSSAY